MLAPTGGQAHNLLMSDIRNTPESKKVKRSQKRGATYRGVRLQPVGDGSRFTDEEVIEAVKAAIRMNPDAFTNKVTS